MKLKLTLLLILLVQSLFAQDKTNYLTQNRADLRVENPNLTDLDFNIIGFGALHGSAKTYEAEYEIVSNLVEKGLLDYYIIEANYSQAYYFQEYLETGDEELLKELVIAFQSIVAQEGSIETFEYWKSIRALRLKYPDKPFKVIGCDAINEHKFPIKHLLKLTNRDNSWTQLNTLDQLLKRDYLNFAVWSRDTYNEVRSFVDDYLANKEKYKPFISDLETFDFVIETLNRNFQKKRKKREQLIFDNYLYLKDKLNLDNKKQFAKYGYFHIQKNNEGKYPSFFTRLIENEVYPRDKVITIMGYLTKSKVLWDKKYDKNRKYKNYTTKAGYGISDYWKENFEGIEYLKKSKLSDLTMFKLNKEDSPYAKGTDLVEINKFLKDYNTTKLKGKNTLQFIDYAVLISDSKEQVPIEEMQ